MDDVWSTLHLISLWIIDAISTLEYRGKLAAHFNHTMAFVDEKQQIGQKVKIFTLLVCFSTELIMFSLLIGSQ